MSKAESDRERILNIKPARIEIAMPGRVPLQLHALSLSDVESLRSRLELEPIEFAISTLTQQARDPSVRSELKDMPPSTLLRICRTWASHRSTLSVAPERIRRFNDFKNLAQDRIAEWDGKVSRLGQQLANAISVSLPRSIVPERLQRELAKIEATARNLSHLAAASPAVELTESIATSFRASLPDPFLIQQAIEEANEGKLHLDKHGYGFVTGEWPIGELREIARGKPAARAVHRAFLNLTRDQDFVKDLLSRISDSPMLARRAPILEAVYSAHHSRNYALSVPVLYAQLEGVLTDLLVIEGLAHRKGTRAVRPRSGGELRGLVPKARQYSQGPSVIRRFVTEKILEELSSDRNAILHGAKTGYRQASRSARLLLLVDVLTKVITTAERTDQSGA